MSVSLVEVMAAASQRLAPLSGECAGHAVLAAADQLLTHPRSVGAADVLIEENGAVRLGHGGAADARGCDEALRELLDGLLTVAHSGGAGLLRVGRRTATGDLGQLVRELEVALIPANRAAARRSLARLYRETSRAREAGSLRAGPAVALERRAPPVAPARPVVPARPVASALAAPPAVTAYDLTEVAAAAAPTPAAPEATGELLAVTEVRCATAPRGAPAPAAAGARAAVAAAPLPAAELELELALADIALEDIEVEDIALEDVEVEDVEVEDVEVEDIEVEAIEVDVTPAPTPVRHTQPLPRVEPRRELHHTVPLPPVIPRPRVAEHETPLEPVLSRRTGPPGRRSEVPDIHETPYLGTQVSAVPVYDERSREAWQVPAQTGAGTIPSPEWETDEATTDPAPVVAWGAPDEDAELAQAAPLPACPALAVEPRVAPPPLKEPRVFRPSEVEELVESFRIAEPEPDAHLARSLKQLAGITATPPPVRADADNAPLGHASGAVPEPSEPGSPIRPTPTVPVS